MAIAKWLPVLLLGCAGMAHAGSMWDSMGLPSAVGGDGPPASILSPEAKQGFAGSVALGYIGTTGNTNTSSVDARLNVSYTSGRWFDDVALERQRVSNDGNTTVNRYDFQGQTNYLFTSHNYVFGHASYERNDFGGFRRQTSEAFGYGRRLLDEGKQTMDLEVGLGARQSRLLDDTEQNSGILRLGGKYEWQFSDNGSFGQALALEKGSDNTFGESITSLRANLMEQLAVVVSYTIRHNTQVPDNVANTDTYTTVSLQYGFK